MTRDPSRRDLLVGAALAAGGLGLSRDAALAQQALPPTPECRDSHAPTRAQTEGPFFKPSSPQRSDLREPGLGSKTVVLSGLVLTRSCKPVASAIVDLWHADDKGDYDNRGFRCRGHVLTDEAGRYQFRTILPALYPGRTRHYHVKVAAPQRSPLTTQLYFPADAAANRRDGLFRPELLVKVADGRDGLAANFNFVLDIV
jgi:protocatechuate 3,4-dioxygenase beta subunit